MKNEPIAVFLVLGLLTYDYPSHSYRDDCGPVWLTHMQLLRMEAELCRYYQLADAKEWKAIHQVQSLPELWLLLNRKFDIVRPLGPPPDGQEYLIDPWHRPYVFKMGVTGKETVLRISSGHGNHHYVEMAFDNTKKGVRTKYGWVRPETFFEKLRRWLRL